jgi:hypothetical protein
VSRKSPHDVWPRERDAGHRLALRDGTSWQLTPTPILTLVELAALPPGRIVVMHRTTGLLDSERIEQLAIQAAHRQFAELADPPGLYYPDARRVGGGVAVPGVSPVGTRPRPDVVPAVLGGVHCRR